MLSWGFVRSFVGKLSVISAMTIASGCASALPPPPLPSESIEEMGPTLDSRNVIRVCAKQPGVPRHKDFWAIDGSGHLVLEDSELGQYQRNGQSIYYFDPDANPTSTRMLPIPHNTLQCAERKQSVLSSNGHGTPKTPTPEAQQPAPALQPEQASGAPPSPARVAGAPSCPGTTEPGQARARSTGTTTCVRTRTLRAPTQPASPSVAKPAPKESTAVAQTASTPASPALADWNVAAPILSGLDPQRVMECVGSLCHARHQNFVKKGVTPSGAGWRESRSLSPNGGGGAKTPKGTTRKPPTGPKSAATGKPAQAETPVKPQTSEAPKVKEPNRNRVDGRPATLYEKVDKDGNLLKHGVTHHENPRKRYTRKKIGDGDALPKERAPRTEMIKKERELVETNPGPENREPWAGKRKPPQTGEKK